MEESGLHTRFREDAPQRTRDIGREKDSVPIYVMCEIPSNVILADEFLEIFDGMSIGSNDLTQFTLGLDRDSGIVSKVANENDPAVKQLISEIIPKCRAKKNISASAARRRPIIRTSRNFSWKRGSKAFR